MSNPIDRSSNPDKGLHSAPKWARERDSVPGAGPRLPRATNIAPVNSPDFESERFRFPGSLEPSSVPEPPTRERWRHESARSLVRSGGAIRVFFRFFLVAVFAFVVAIAIVLVSELPNIQSFVAKQRSATNFDGGPPRAPAGSSTTASEPRLVGAARSSRAPSTAEQKTAAIDPAATAPIMPTQPVVATPGPADPAPAPSLPANPPPAVVAPPTANVAQSAASTAAASVNTVSAQSEKPVHSLGPDEIKILLKQGEDFVSVGDFASARLVFRRVWEANDTRGALALAATYDPVVLARIGAKGATPDVAKAREWYVKARDLGSPDAAPRLEALASQNFAMPAQKNAALASTGKETSNEAASQNSLPSEGPTPAGSYWKHGKSIMRLEATGLSRKFFFYKPSDAELEAGAKAESLRFDGQVSGKGYTGTAFLYSDKCGRSAFQVSGEIENNDGRVVLSGRSPQVDSDCREIGRSDQKLVFDLMETPSK
jgi:hypothetical protein